MKRPHFLLLLATILILQSIRATSAANSSSRESRHVFRLPTQIGSEARLALGLKLRWSECDIFDLELIPRLSENVATELLQQKNNIGKSSFKDCRQLRGVKGIGQKTSELLCRTIDFMQ